MRAFANHARRALGLAIAALALSAVPATAAPKWEVSLTNEPTTLPRSDERIDYVATVGNGAPKNPQLGDELTCNETPVDGKNWFGDPTPAFEVEWLRNGVPIPGTKAPAAATPGGNTYTTTAADAGKSLQCLVKATNQSAGSGTATTVAGSNVITDVITATGVGTLEAGSDIVKNVSSSGGRFGHGQTITGPGIPADTTIIGFDVNPSIQPPTQLFLSKPATAAGTQSLAAGPGPFGKGATISGPNIPPGTTVTGVNGLSLTLSANATDSEAGVPISGAYAPIASSIVSRPPTLVEPAPNPAPPSGESRPEFGVGTVAVEGANLECKAPTGWSGTGITWSFQILRNGEPIPGATSSTYTVQAGDAEPPSILQCEAIAEDAAGNEAVAISQVRPTDPKPPNPYSLPVSNEIASVTFSNTISGPVTFELELPGGEETLAYRFFNPTNESLPPVGWNCSAQLASGAVHARATCTRSDPLLPGNSYPPIGVVAFLGEDAPDVGAAVATVSGGGAEAASAEATYTFTPGLSFGVLDGSFEAAVLNAAGDDFTAAGGHAHRAYTTFGFNSQRGVGQGLGGGGAVHPIDNVKDVVVDVPRGFTGNAQATPQLCGSIEAVILALCPEQSVVGGIDVYTYGGSPPNHNIYPNDPNTAFTSLPIYAVEPEFGTPAQFAFAINRSGLEVPYTIVPELRPEEGYAIAFRTAPVIMSPPLYGTNVNLCNFGAKLEGTGNKAIFDHCYEAGESGSYPIPLFTNPTRCAGPPPHVDLHVGSWQDPGQLQTYGFDNPPITDCDKVSFDPEIDFEPTSTQADSPTGLDVEVTVPTDGLEEPTGTAQAHLKRVRVTFPAGMAINASAGHGLGSCSAEQVKLRTNEPIECPDSSKIGSMEVETPIIEEKLVGDVYLAKQGEVKGALTGFYVVFDSKKDGLLIKIPAKIEPNPKTGQLVVTIDDSPEAPFSKATLHFAQGPRAALLNPPKCGNYKVTAELVPWTAVDPDNPTAAETVTETSTFQVNRGPGGGPCPRGSLEPKLSGGTTDPVAGKTSPFLLRLQREDGTQRFSALNMKVPLGLTAYLKGIPYCPEGAIQAAEARKVPTQGVLELASPSCPAASQVGTAIAGAGAGSNPFYVDTGKTYLAGPYKGAPASIVVIAPAVAGPLDLGNVVIRNAIYIDPETTEISVVSDPIPTIIHGILPDIRDIRVAIDRPGFVLNPTSCEEKSLSVEVKGEAGASASVSNRFQVAGCDQLKFKPKVTTRLFGGTGRGAHPRLRGVMRAKPGQANIKKVVVTVPRSEFLDQAHIRTICTRVQFAQDACPKGSIYGKATATTPLLDYPLSGPVYMRSSDHELPDLVVAVKGPPHQPIEAAVVGRIDSIKGQIRASFEAIPDVPLTKVVLEMRGGNRGLLVNSRNICARAFRATVQMEGHNGATRTTKPVMRNSKCKKAKKRRGGKSRGAKGKGRAQKR